ncbi:MAG: SMP-30/gluconolactonase/LRE family protein [Steroidobacteraceae bacterium]
MRTSVWLAVTLGFVSTSVVLARTPLRQQGPGLKASQDAREAAVLTTCRRNHPGPPIDFAAVAKQPRPKAFPAPTTVEAIPGVIAAGTHWRSIWHESGNNADGIVGTRDGGLLVAQQDNSDVVKIDAAGHASVLYKDTNTGGALSIDKQGQLFVVERGLHQAIWKLAPSRTMLADSYEGDSIDCLGNYGLNDLTAAGNGGVYFTVGGLYYAAPDGTITRQGTVSNTNGIILSPDEKTLYVTSGAFGQPHGTLVAFDVQSDGMLTNPRTFAQLTGGGDGSTIDSQGRIYVTSGSVIDVLSPADGRLLGVIPGPKGDDLISVAFGGRGKHTLFAVGLAAKFAKGGLGLPSDKMKQGAEISAIRMLAHGYVGRAK